MNNPYARFSTNQDLETEGVLVNYGEFRVKLARAGGSNTKYNKLADKKARAQRRMGSVNLAVLKAISVELLVEACVLNWEVKIDGNWQQGLIDPETLDLVPFSKDNVAKVLDQLPDLAAALVDEASNLELFLQDEVKAESGN